VPLQSFSHTAYLTVHSASAQSFAQIADAASEGYLSLMTVSAQLHSLLTRENSFNCQIMMALFGSILSPVQVRL